MAKSELWRSSPLSLKTLKENREFFREQEIEHLAYTCGFRGLPDYVPVVDDLSRHSGRLMVELAIATKSDTLGGLRLCIDELLQSRALLTGFTRRVYDQEGIIIHHDWSVVVCYFLLLTATDREPFRAHARMGGLRESVVGIAREVALG